MKPFNNYAETQVLTEQKKLPKGGYICKILNAEVKTYNGRNGSFEKLEISFDITEGEHKDFYANNYRAQRSEDKKWKGVLRVYVPTDDGSESDALTKSIFKGVTTAVEESNNGYHWDWNEAGLKGKAVGIIFRNEEWEFNNRSGWTAQPFKAVSVSAIKEGKFTVPEDKPLKNKTTASYSSAPSYDTSNFEEIATNDDLPFDI